MKEAVAAWIKNRIFEPEPVKIPRKQGRKIEVREFGIAKQIIVKTVQNGGVPCPYQRFHRG